MSFLYVRIPREKVRHEQHKVGTIRGPHAIKMHDGSIVVCLGSENDLKKGVPEDVMYIAEKP